MTAGRKYHRARARFMTGGPKVKQRRPPRRTKRKAAVQGHRSVGGKRNGRNYVASCQCGWRSPVRNSKGAQRHFQKHLGDVAAASRVDISKLGPIHSKGREAKPSRTASTLAQPNSEEPQR